jgi:chromosome segregation ATPase
MVGAISTISGRQSLAEIETALQEATQEVDRLKAEIDKANQDKVKLIADRLEAFRALAKFRTDLALVDGVIDDADKLSGQVKATLRVRQKTLNGLQQREADARAEREKVLAKQKEADAEIERLEKEYAGVAEKAKRALGSVGDFGRRAKRLEELAGMVAKAAEKAEKSKAEEAEKGAPYRGDPLFMYLWQRKYGSADYHPIGIIRLLDGWVARLVGYNDACANFAMLTAIPERLAEHVDRLKAAMQEEKGPMDTMIAAKIRELAGSDLSEAIRAAHASRDALDAELAHADAELTETGNQLKFYAQGQDESFRTALDQTAKFLEGQSLSTLLSEARGTPDVADDEIVAMIGKLSDEVQAVERLAKTRNDALEAAYERKQELVKLAADFRRARYDRPGSEIETGIDGQTLLMLLLQGAITAADYWARTQRGYHWNGPSDYGRRDDDRDHGRFGGRGDDDDGPDFRTGGGF